MVRKPRRGGVAGGEKVGATGTGGEGDGEEKGWL